ncbi:MAG: hypothetical protein M3461_19190 [Pseudomonadota bacterium]|nr:hypothetical protein [Pseudomonadota bacterium]
MSNSLDVLAVLAPASYTAYIETHPEPSMPMPGLSNCWAMGPIFRIGRRRTGEIE